MLLKSVEYVRPDTVPEALDLLGSNVGAAPLAGGQSLTNILKHRVASVDLLVDISALAELRTITRTAEGVIEIGSCVTYDEIDHSRDVRAGHDIVARVAAHIEDQQIRNRGTIGGNCCLSDPTNNLPPLLVALDATMNIRSAGGSRQVAAEDFFKGYFLTALEPGELLTSITIPPLRSGVGAGYVSVAVAADSKAIVRAAVRVEVKGVIVEARVVLARVASVPVRHRGMEDALRGAPPTAESVRAAAATIGDEVEPISDSHGSSQYRREMARVVAQRAVLEAIAEGGGK
ncbi:MAG: FAD binding domain-containing protein [Candidatus Dormibacteria bacterium]